MYRSLNTLQTASAARLRSMPVKLPAGQFAGSEVVLENLRQRNAVLDWLFYDVKVVRDAEAREISPWLAAEGAILLVPPTGAASLTRCASIDEFIAAGGAAIRSLVVAGVGSSALGAAALARNVADAVGAPVAAVVSGYGLADFTAEALGGFFWFGALNSVRHSFEWLDRLRETGVIADPGTSLGGEAIGSPMYPSKDTRTVQALLSHPALSFDLLLGHSKGNLVLSEALFALQAANPARLRTLGEQTRIVTLSAKIAMPLACHHVIDVMGQFDVLGLLNSRLDIRTDIEVPRVGHHTNTDLLFHLPVTASLRQLREDGRL